MSDATLKASDSGGVSRRPTCEDVPRDFTIVATGLQFPEGPNWTNSGTIILVEVRGQHVTKVFPDGRLEPLAYVGGGPNSCALGPDGAIFVCNNGGYPWHQGPDGAWEPRDPTTGSRTPEGFLGGWIDRIEPDGSVSRLYEAADGKRLSAPCDLTVDRRGVLWFTDAGKARARSKDYGGIYRALSDGSRIDEMVYGLPGPNGIGFSPAGDRLYVADSPTGRLWMWQVHDGELGSSPGERQGTVLNRLPGAMVLDSLGIDSEGRVIVGVVGAGVLAVFEPDGELSFIRVPDQMPTNVCFGGDDGRTLYVTLAATGALGSFRWRCPGSPTFFK